MSNFIFIQSPRPILTNFSYRYVDYGINPSGTFNFGDEDHAIMMSSYGVEVKLIVTFDKPTSKHVNDIRLEWSLNNSEWFEFESNPDGIPIDTTDYIFSEFANPSDSSLQKASVLTFTKFIQIPSLNYKKIIYIRGFLIDYYGTEYSLDFNFNYIADYNKELFFYTPEITGEPDTKEFPIVNFYNVNNNPLSVSYTYKNYVYLKPYKNTMTFIEFEYSLDGINWYFIDYDVVSSPVGNVARIEIPYYKEIIYFRYNDNEKNYRSNDIELYAEYILGGLLV